MKNRSRREPAKPTRKTEPRRKAKLPAKAEPRRSRRPAAKKRRAPSVREVPDAQVDVLEPVDSVDGDGAIEPADGALAPDEVDAIEETPPAPASRLTICGIGASAGGLEAVIQMLEGLDDLPETAIVVVQHMAPDQTSLLPELIGARTPLAVVKAEDGIELEQRHVYVVTPNTEIELADGHLHVVARADHRHVHLPIDRFFRSLAASAGNRAIGVVLSGNGSDGSIGIREIKGAGGITIAQDPKTAKFDSMPRGAMGTGFVDLVLPPRDIGAELRRLARHPYVRQVVPRQKGDDLPIAEDQLQKVFVHLRRATGVDFAHYKPPTIRRRLQRRMALHKLQSIERYLGYLQENPAEIQALYQDILIHVTRFFREPDSYAALAEHVFPKVAVPGRPDGPIRVWVPGCSTGEEAYSIAIALVEHLGDHWSGVTIQVFATDVSEAAIEHARAGVYPESIAADVSPERLRRYFAATEAGYRINKAIRDLCVFARQDLTRDPPFSKLDIVVCRNVLIYLSQPLQRRLMSVFHYALKPNGFLVLGSAETVGTQGDLFAVVEKKHRIYVKKHALTRADMEFRPSETPSVRIELPRRGAGPARTFDAAQEVSRILLDRYAPAGVLVDPDLKIVHFRGNTGLYLEPPQGEADLHVLKMAREGLLHGLRSALHEVRKSAGPVRKDGLRVRSNGSMRDVNLEVIPVSERGGGHVLVLFEDVTAGSGGHGDERKRARSKSPGTKRTKHDPRIYGLEQELAASRDYLQSIIQDLEAANEELQSANEEILSSNEELQSTNEELDTAKEELQSTNEELNTVNEELHGRNEELSRLNSDLVNLLGSVQIAIVMVASDLRIRRFTPMAEKVLNLIPTDIGRPISDIKPNIACPDLEQLIARSIDTVTTQELEVEDRQGRSFTLRIRPYKNVDNRIDGAVLALFELDAGRRPKSGRPA